MEAIIKLNDCPCIDWAVTDGQAALLGNGHNPTCEHFKPTVRAVELLEKLTAGIKWWADQEDGVPEELWDAYAEAVFVTTGRIVSPEEA